MRNTNASLKIPRIAVAGLLIITAVLPLQLHAAAQDGDQETMIPIGILDLRDESGSGRTDLSAKLTQRLRQRLFEIYPDLLPKMLGRESGADPVRGMTVEELTDLGRQYGVLYVLRGGLMPARLKTDGGIAEVNVNLYAELVSTGTGEIKSMRGVGEGTQEASANAGLEWGRVDFTSADFLESALGLALSDGLDQLAEAVYGQLALFSESISQPPVEERVSEELPDGEETIEDEWAEEAPMEDVSEEQELLQLIADAETVLEAGSASNPEMADRISQALSDLRNALAIRADQLQRGEISKETDLAVQEAETGLRQAIDEMYESPTMAGTYEQEPDGSGKIQDSLAQADTITNEVAALIQKIQDLQAMLQNAGEDSYAAEDETEYTEDYYPEEGWTEYAEESEDAYLTDNEPGYPEMFEEDMEEVSGVILEDGEPVEGAEVVDTVSGASTTTGSDGSYVLPVPAGTMSNLQVSVLGKQVASGRMHVVGGGSNVADFPLNNASAGKTGIGILSSTAMTRAIKTPGGTLKGTIRDANNRPVPFALVQVPGVGVVRTNSLGEYIFMNIPAGSYQVKVQQTGFEPQVSRIGINPGETSRITVRITPAAPVSRQIFPPRLTAGASGATLRGQVLDNRRSPLPGVKISIIRHGAAVSSSTGREGKYAMRNISPGTYRVVASKAGFQIAAEEVKLEAGKIEKRDFNMNRVSPIVDKLHVASETSRGTLEGRVRGEGKGVLAEALIEAKAINSKQSPFRMRTGADGKFAIKIPAGRYRLEVQRSGYRSYSRTVRIEAGETARQDIRLRRLREPAKPGVAKTESLKTVDHASLQAGGKSSSGAAGSSQRTSSSEKSRTAATLGSATAKVRNGRIEGRITDSLTKQGIADASVTLEKAGNTKSDRSGAFRLENVLPGKYRLTVARKGYRSSTKTVTVREGRALRANVILAPSVKTITPPATILKK